MRVQQGIDQSVMSKRPFAPLFRQRLCHVGEGTSKGFAEQQ
jgi:hypothetical protein